MSKKEGKKTLAKTLQERKLLKFLKTANKVNIIKERKNTLDHLYLLK